MRLQLKLALLCAVFAHSATASADNRAATWLSVYSDDDGLTVVSPQVSARADVGEGVEVAAKYDVDVITAATTDVVSAASPRGYEEERHGLDIGASWEPEPGATLSLHYLPSWEPDYRSHGVAAQGGREWLERRLTTRIGASVAFDEVGRGGDMMAWRSLTTVRMNARAAWVLERRTVVEVGYELQRSRGFQASPYRFVDIEWVDPAAGPGDDPILVATPEAVPERRIRHSVIGNARHSLGRGYYARSGYRLYVDTWGIVSHTADLELSRAVGWDRLLFGVLGRFYHQGAADFYTTGYRTAAGTLPEYRTADKMLAKSWSVLGGARVEMTLRPPAGLAALRGILKLEVYDQHFVDFAPLAGRRALIVSGGASAEF